MNKFKKYIYFLPIVFSLIAFAQQATPLSPKEEEIALKMGFDCDTREICAEQFNNNFKDNVEKANLEGIYNSEEKRLAQTVLREDAKNLMQAIESGDSGAVVEAAKKLLTNTELQKDLRNAGIIINKQEVRATIVINEEAQKRNVDLDECSKSTDELEESGLLKQCLDLFKSVSKNNKEVIKVIAPEIEDIEDFEDGEDLADRALTDKTLFGGKYYGIAKDSEEWGEKCARNFDNPPYKCREAAVEIFGMKAEELDSVKIDSRRQIEEHSNSSRYIQEKIGRIMSEAKGDSALMIAGLEKLLQELPSETPSYIRDMIMRMLDGMKQRIVYMDDDYKRPPRDYDFISREEMIANCMRPPMMPAGAYYPGGSPLPSSPSREYCEKMADEYLQSRNPKQCPFRAYMPLCSKGQPSYDSNGCMVCQQKHDEQYDRNPGPKKEVRTEQECKKKYSNAVWGPVRYGDAIDPNVCYVPANCTAVMPLQCPPGTKYDSSEVFPWECYSDRACKPDVKVCPLMPTRVCAEDEEPDKYSDIPGCGRYVQSCKKKQLQFGKQGPVYGVTKEKCTAMGAQWIEEAIEGANCYYYPTICPLVMPRQCSPGETPKEPPPWSCGSGCIVTNYPQPIFPKGQKEQIWNSYGLRSSIREDADPVRINDLKTACKYAPSWSSDSDGNIWLPGAGDSNSKDFGMPNKEKCLTYTTPPSTTYPTYPGTNYCSKYDEQYGNKEKDMAACKADSACDWYDDNNIKCSEKGYNMMSSSCPVGAVNAFNAAKSKYYNLDSSGCRMVYSAKLTVENQQKDVDVYCTGGMDYKTYPSDGNIYGSKWIVENGCSQTATGMTPSQVTDATTCYNNGWKWNNAAVYPTPKCSYPGGDALSVQVGTTPFISSITTASQCSSQGYFWGTDNRCYSTQIALNEATTGMAGCSRFGLGYWPSMGPDGVTKYCISPDSLSYVAHSGLVSEVKKCVTGIPGCAMDSQVVVTTSPINTGTYTGSTTGAGTSGGGSCPSGSSYDMADSGQGYCRVGGICGPLNAPSTTSFTASLCLPDTYPMTSGSGGYIGGGMTGGVNYSWGNGVQSMISPNVTEAQKTAGKAVVTACVQQLGLLTLTGGNITSWSGDGVPTGGCMSMPTGGGMMGSGAGSGGCKSGFHSDGTIWDPDSSSSRGICFKDQGHDVYYWVGSESNEISCSTKNISGCSSGGGSYSGSSCGPGYYWNGTSCIISPSSSSMSCDWTNQYWNSSTNACRSRSECSDTSSSYYNSSECMGVRGSTGGSGYVAPYTSTCSSTQFWCNGACVPMGTSCGSSSGSGYVAPYTAPYSTDPSAGCSQAGGTWNASGSYCSMPAGTSGYVPSPSSCMGGQTWQVPASGGSGYCACPSGQGWINGACAVTAYVPSQSLFAQLFSQLSNIFGVGNQPRVIKKIPLDQQKYLTNNLGTNEPLNYFISSQFSSQPGNTFDASTKLRNIIKKGPALKRRINLKVKR